MKDTQQCQRLYQATLDLLNSKDAVKEVRFLTSLTQGAGMLLSCCACGCT